VTAAYTLHVVLSAVSSLLCTCLLASQRTHSQLNVTAFYITLLCIQLINTINIQVAAKAQYKYGKLSFMKLDLSSLADVRAFAKQFEAAKLPLDVLILNAGVMMGK
jgi:NAD(P)-dependent dehydrogenase (short-subunit alcohol dehydrogenase family)